MLYSFSRVTCITYILCCLPFLSSVLYAQEPLTPRETEIGAASSFVPVKLDDHANHQGGLATPAPRVTVQGIPFDLVAKAGTDNLFLKDAQWPDWQKDPLDYYSPYDSAPTKLDPQRPFVRVPVADYSAVYLLAASDRDPNLLPALTLRIGAFDGMWRVDYRDFSAAVPRFGETGGAGVMRAIPAGAAGNVFLVRVPIGRPMAQDFRDRTALDVEITKEVRLSVPLPDPGRFQTRPLGLPSGVHIFGMTFERAPVQLDVTSGESGHIFNEPQVPTFRVGLRNLFPLSGNALTIEGTATDYYGNVTKLPAQTITMYGWIPTRTLSLPVKVSRRGFHRLSLTLSSPGRPNFLTRETTFALLPPDTRKHRDKSPLGTWDFGGSHYTPADADTVGPLYVKAGLRYGMFNFTEEERKRYGIIKGSDPAATTPAEVEANAKYHREHPELPLPPRYLIFHETAISGPHITRTPDVFTGRPPYRLTEEDAKRFKTLWDGALGAGPAIRKHFPKSTIQFGNGIPHTLEEFLRHKFPRQHFDVRGNEAGSFMRVPEAQPLDFVSNNAGLWMDRQILDHYGYKDVPIEQCYEIMYPSTNPGNLAPSTQASYFVRGIMHSLSWRIPVIRPGIITDTGNSYYYGMWGAGGLCYGLPDVRPKPAYVAMATLTQVLDGAQFTRVVPTGSPTTYAFEFRTPNRQYVTCLWTVRGTRPVSFRVNGRDAVITDLMSNTTKLALVRGSAGMTLSPEPLFLQTERPIEQLTAGTPTHPRFEAPAATSQQSALLSSLSQLSEWTVENEPNHELEVYNFMNPRRKGDFAYREVSGFEGESNVLSLKPRLPVPGSQYLQMYSVLRHNQGIEIPGNPTEIGVMVNGNGGWGRLIFELEDASGQRWISIGAEQAGTPGPWMADWMPTEEFKKLKGSNLSDWNSDDPWGRSFINFEGWRYVRFPLPGNYPGEGYHWPANGQWRVTKADGSAGDGVVKYPLKFKKLVITMPEKVLHATEYKPVPRQEIYLKDLRVTYEDPEQAWTMQ